MTQLSISFKSNDYDDDGRDEEDQYYGYDCLMFR